MASTFLRKLSSNISTSLTSIGGYSPTANTGAIVLGVTISNTGLNTVYANVALNNGATNFHITKLAEIPANGSFVAVGGEHKIVMQAGDSIQVSATGNVDAILTVMESVAVGLTVDPGGSGVQEDLESLSGTEDLESGSGVEDLMV
jgi:hypothetical protein